MSFLSGSQISRTGAALLFRQTNARNSNISMLTCPKVNIISIIKQCSSFLFFLYV